MNTKWMEDVYLSDMQPDIISEIIIPILSLGQDRNEIFDHCPQGALIAPPLYKELIDISILDSVYSTISEQIPSIYCEEKSKITTIDISKDTDIAKINNFAIIHTDPIEQHGPFLSLGTDINISRLIASQLCSEHPVDFLPGLEYGIMRWGLALGGCISLEEVVHKKMVENYVNVLTKMGYHRILFLSTHLAPNHVDNLNSVISKYKNQISIRLATPLLAIEEVNFDRHAGTVETSLCLFADRGIKIAELFQAQEIDGSFTVDEMERYWTGSLELFRQKAIEKRWNGIVGALPPTEMSYGAYIAQMRSMGKTFSRLMEKYCVNKLFDD